MLGNEQLFSRNGLRSNIGPDSTGYVFIGVADDEKDAKRIQQLDGIQPLQVADKYVVGVDREVKILGGSIEDYFQKILAEIRASDLSEPLKSQVKSNFDMVTYKNLSVIRITVQSQDKISFVGDKAYVREGSETQEVSGRKLVDVSGRFK